MWPDLAITPIVFAASTHQSLSTKKFRRNVLGKSDLADRVVPAHQNCDGTLGENLPRPYLNRFVPAHQNSDGTLRENLAKLILLRFVPAV